MEEKLKQRLVGATVLVSLGVIFIPMLLEGPSDLPEPTRMEQIPPKPAGGFSSRIIPVDESTSNTMVRAPEHLEAPQPVIETNQAPRVTVTPNPIALPKPLPTKQAVQPKVQATPSDQTDSEQLRVGLTAWAVQLGSFSNRNNAIALRDRLRKMDYDAFVEAVAGDKGMVTRVYIGPVLERHQAAKLLESEKLKQLQTEMKLKGLIRRYPGG